MLVRLFWKEKLKEKGSHAYLNVQENLETKYAKLGKWTSFVAVFARR